MDSADTAKILELSAEDDYGSWELWWSVRSRSPGAPRHGPKQNFVSLIENLIKDGKLVAKTRGDDGKLQVAEFDSLRLLNELERADQPDPDTFYWFGTE